jgi:hypothetical protein
MRGGDTIAQRRIGDIIRQRVSMSGSVQGTKQGGIELFV